MQRMVVEVDNALLGEAAESLGTTTPAATANAALAEMIKRQQRKSFFDWLESGGLPELRRGRCC
ncbi:type II toxin-antitoxin system VapB family antitoxin [Microlunatus sp. GCM10028923]|uniref:type II toxin-antitoxin system VapB family antitoxin n=1 Tax=Microlunatus sp. GCM10028923 TaxID=3273400 RepID=UPI00360C754D